MQGRYAAISGHFSSDFGQKTQKSFAPRPPAGGSNTGTRPTRPWLCLLLALVGTAMKIMDFVWSFFGPPPIRSRPCPLVPQAQDRPKWGPRGSQGPKSDPGVRRGRGRKFTGNSLVRIPPRWENWSCGCYEGTVPLGVQDRCSVGTAGGGCHRALPCVPGTGLHYRPLPMPLHFRCECALRGELCTCPNHEISEGPQ